MRAVDRPRLLFSGRSASALSADSRPSPGGESHAEVRTQRRSASEPLPPAHLRPRSPGPSLTATTARPDEQPLVGGVRPRGSQRPAPPRHRPGARKATPPLGDQGVAAPAAGPRHRATLVTVTVTGVWASVRENLADPQPGRPGHHVGRSRSPDGSACASSHWAAAAIRILLRRQLPLPGHRELHLAASTAYTASGQTRPAKRTSAARSRQHLSRRRRSDRRSSAAARRRSRAAGRNPRPRCGCRSRWDSCGSWTVASARRRSVARPWSRRRSRP